MKPKKVISRKNIPLKSPLLLTVVSALSMDLWNAPEWLCGAAGLFLLVYWAVFLSVVFREDSIDVLNKIDKE